MTTLTNTQVNLIHNFLRCAVPKGSVVDRNGNTIHVYFDAVAVERWFLKSATHALIKSFAIETGEHYVLHLYYYFSVEGD